MGGALGSLYAILTGIGLTMIARPLGGIIFGNLGDRVGRRHVLMITIIGFSVLSASIGLIPAYAIIGIWAALLFAILRFVEGIFIGGEYAGGHPLVMELSPQGRRGFFGGLVQQAFPWGAVLGSVVVLGFLSLLGPAGMAAYGWRYVFFTGAIPAFVALLIRYRILHDPAIFEEIKSKGKTLKVPVASLFKPPTLYKTLQVFMLAFGFFFTTYAFLALGVPLFTAAGLKPGMAVSAFLIGTVGAATSTFYMGWISDKIGRRKMILLVAILNAIFSIPLYYAASISAKYALLALVLLLSFAIGSISEAQIGAVPAYLSERFSTEMRASGLGTTYSLGVGIAGGLVAFLAVPLHGLLYGIQGPVPWLTCGLIGTVGAVIFGVAAYIGPETKHVDLGKVAE
jgi:MFS family permease